MPEHGWQDVAKPKGLTEGDSKVAYKGFHTGRHPQMFCREQVYVEGETYTQEEHPVLCAKGFHACELPLDVWQHYFPGENKAYHRVECSGKIDANDPVEIEQGISDTKIAAQTITIRESLSLVEMVFEHHRAVTEKWGDPEKHGVVQTHGFATVAATDFGRGRGGKGTKWANSVAINEGGWSIAAAAGFHYSTATTTGVRSVAVVTGAGGVALADGNYSVAAAANRQSYAGNTSEEGGVAIVTGSGSHASVEHPSGLAIAAGMDSCAKGPVGSWLVLKDDHAKKPEDAVRAVYVDGEVYLADTYYMLSLGEVWEE